MENSIINLLNEDICVCFDTNVYLNLYEYNPHIAEAYIEMANKVSTKIVLPMTVKREFEKNHSECKGRQKKKFKDISRNIGKSTNIITEKLNKQLKILEDFGFPNVDRLSTELLGKIEEVDVVIKEYIDENKVVEEMTKKFTDEDKVENLISSIIANGNLLTGYEVDELYSICEEGERRYKKQVPPGYKDGHPNKTGIQMYNDLIIWKEVIRYCKYHKKKLIFITDDVKPDWYKINSDNTLTFREELIDEFKNDTNMEMIGITSKTFFGAAAEKYNIAIPNIIDSVLDFDLDNYFEYLLNAGLEYDIRDELIYSEEEYINIDSISNYGGSAFEYEEIDEFKLNEYRFDGCYNSIARYELEFYVKATISTRSYWGRDEDTKEEILSDKEYSIVEGVICVELLREVDSYIDTITDDYDYKGFKIISGELSQIEFFSGEELCIECGRNIGEVIHRNGGMVCMDCAVGNENGEICPACGEKVHSEDMAGNGFCLNCTRENPNL